MRSVATGGRALRFAAILTAGVACGAGRAALSAEDAPGPKPDVAALGQKLAKSGSRTERISIVTMLGKTGDPAALGHVVPLIDDGNFALRRCAAGAAVSILREGGGDAPAALFVGEALGARLSATGQMEAIGILDKLSPPRDAARAIIRYLKRGDLSEQAAKQCMRVLARPRYAGVREVREEFLERLESDDPSMAANAAEALGRVKMSERERDEVVPALVEQLGRGEEGAAVREAARRSLAHVAGEEKSSYGWRAWAVKEGYADPAEPLPEEERPERPPVVFPPVDREPSYVSAVVYVAVGVGAAGIAVLLLFARATLIKRSTESIEAKRRKYRRRR